jgi:YD repeat-containing protein
MRKVLTVSLGLLLCLSAIALAGDNNAADKTIQGTITRVDTAGKMVTVKEASGNETTVAWNDSTRITGGELKEGASVSLTVSDKGGSPTATSIEVKSAKKPY